MPNMDYCRFQNTLADLRDCEEPLSRRQKDASEEEIDARKQLIRLCHRIASDYPLEDLE